MQRTHFYKIHKKQQSWLYLDLSLDLWLQGLWPRWLAASQYQRVVLDWFKYRYCTNSTPSNWSYQSWSSNGHLEIPQPDNAEAYINGNKESCLKLPTDIYENSIKWHDIACYHPKPFKCKDSDALLDLYPTDEGIRL